MNTPHISKAEQKYLAREAEPEANHIGEKLSARFGHILIIPAYGEGENLFQTLSSVPQGPRGEVLVVLVVNARQDAPSWAHAENQKLLGALEARLGPPTSPGDALRLYPFEKGALLLVDRASPGRFFPAGQGVGLARKIGGDIALALYLQRKIASPWLHFSDADVLLPEDFFLQAEPFSSATNLSALWYPFWHLCDPEPHLAEAMRLYEISLRYYVLGLRAAGSPYAYQTVGSAITVRASCYAQVRGVPRKDAAEDFYLLNKLAKVGAVQRLSGKPLQVEGRTSARVPFGTGKALSQIVGSLVRGEPFRIYHPAIFSHLGAFLAALSGMSLEGLTLTEALTRYATGNVRPELLEALLQQSGALAALEEARTKTRAPRALRRRLSVWFDGFRTLKLVHALRDLAFPSLPVSEALAGAWFAELPRGWEAWDSEQIRRHLFQVEEKRCLTPMGVGAE